MQRAASRIAGVLSGARWPVNLAAALLVCAAAEAAHAQTEPAGKESGLEEVTVTAQKVAENIQTVPMSITAISSESLAIQGIHDFTEVLSEVPNLSYQYGTAGNLMGVSASRGIMIRGISGLNTTSFYINDTPVPVSIDPRILDIDHIEVLEGPQGTLYGEASMGGTVKFVTRSPSPVSFDGVADLDVHDVQGGGVGTFDSVNINAPVATDAAVRFGGYYSYEPGFLTRTYDDPSAINGDDVTGPAKSVDHVGTATSSGGFASFKWQPDGSSLSVEPMFLVQRTVSDGFLATDYSTSDLIQRRALDVPEGWRDTFYLASLSVNLDTPIGNLTSATSYFYRDSFDQDDGSDVTKLLLGLAYVVPTPSLDDLYSEIFAQEFRLVSHITSKLTTTAGLYFNDTFGEFDQNIISPGVIEASGGAINSDVGYLASFPSRSYEGAIYGSATYNLTDRWSLTAGLRKSYLQQRDNGDAVGFFVGPPLIFSLGYRAEAVTPRFSLEYRATDDKMLYATASKGFRPGGTQTIPDICAADIEKFGLQPGVSQYQSDSLWNYELGAKTRWLDGRFTANLAVYDMEWTNIQQEIVLPCGFEATVNGAAARSEGAELELQLTPLPNLLLGFAGGYEQAKITAVLPDSLTLYVGQPLNGVPKWTLSGNATYQFQTQSFGKAYVRADGNYVGQSVSLNTSPVIGMIRPDYTLVNFRIGTQLNSWDVALYMKNILNQYPNLGDEISEVVSYPGRPRYLVGPPRTAGVEVKFNF
jgi:iron complex outermembrane recepter protein